MALFTLWCLILLALALPGMSPGLLGIDAHPPDLWVVVVVYLALRGRGYSAVPWAILLGLVRDGLSLDPLGTHAFVLGCVALLLAEGRSHRGRIEGAGRLLFTAAAALLAGWLYLLRILPLGAEVPLAAFVHVLPTALWTTLFAAFLHPLIDQGRLLDDLCGRRRGLPA